MLEYTLCSASTACDGMVVVLPAVHLERWTAPVGVVVVTGGATRAQTVPAGLAAVPARVAVVVVADAAHPLATPALYRRVVDTVLAGADAAIPGLLLAEVVKEITTTETATMGTVVEAGRSLLRETHRLIQMLMPSQPAGCATPMPAPPRRWRIQRWSAAAGARVILVDGEPANIHVTTPEELALANLMAPAVLHTERSRHGRGTHARRRIQLDGHAQRVHLLSRS